MTSDIDAIMRPALGFRRTRLLPAVMVLLSLPGLAQTAGASACVATTGRADDLRYTRSMRSLADLSLAVANDQQANLTPLETSLVTGACAAEIQVSQMALLMFRDGAVFTAYAPDRIVHAPTLTGSALRINPATSAHPAIAQGRFIMSSRVDAVNSQANGQRTLDVGLWRSGGDYIVAAYIGREGSFDTPVELLRSTQPIRGVTYLPAPDANAGKLELVVDDVRDTVLIGFNWYHAALSRELFSGK